MDFLDDARTQQDDLARLRRALHQDPEIGLELPRTQERVLAALDGLPVELTPGPAGLGSVTAVLRGGRSSGRSVLLRGDMDALPVAEETGLDFASTNGAMHACGHDLHTAALVGAARLLSARRAELTGDVIFMFQPGEEGYDGARHMIEAGVLEASGTVPEAAFALHVASAVFPAGLIAVRPGPIMSAADVLHVEVVGQGGHGSGPHLARDPVVAAAEMVTALQTLVTRRFDVFDPVVVTVGSFHGGTQHNVIPERANFDASVRTFSATNQAAVAEHAVRLCRGIADAHGLQAEIEWETLYPVTNNDPTEADFLAATAAELFGEAATMLMPPPHTGSEDFSRVLQRVPGAFAFLGATPPGLDPTTAPFNHAPQADFDESVLASGAALYAKLAIDRLALAR